MKYDRKMNPRTRFPGSLGRAFQHAGVAGSVDNPAVWMGSRLTPYASFPRYTSTEVRLRPGPRIAVGPATSSLTCHRGFVMLRPPPLRGHGRDAA